MKVIHKFPLAIQAEQAITLSENAKILTIQLQDNKPMLWAIVDEEPELAIVRNVIMIGTGWPINCALPKQYIGTIQHTNYVWHYFLEVQ